MLEIKNLRVKKEGEDILKDISISVGKGEGVVVLGPNGGGKSTLFKGIVGVGDFNLEGSVKLDGEELIRMDTEERVEEGIGYLYQTPLLIEGVELNSLVRAMLDSENGRDDIYEEVRDRLKDLDMDYLYDREVNVGLSGGEVKRSELFTLSLMEDVKLYLFDEPDSGVDIENVKRLGKFIKEMVGVSAYMIVTHSGEILKYLNPDRGVVVMNGEVVHEGDPEDILAEVKKNGYSNYGKGDV